MAFISREQIRTGILQRGRYTVAPNELFEVKGLSIQAKMIWVYILSKPEKWRSSRNNLARNLGIWAPAVTKAILELQEFNMIFVDRRTQRWEFRLYPPHLWISPVVIPNRIGSDPVLPGFEENQKPDRIRSSTGSEAIRLGAETGSDPIHTQEEINLKEEPQEGSEKAPETQPGPDGGGLNGPPAGPKAMGEKEGDRRALLASQLKLITGKEETPHGRENIATKASLGPNFGVRISGLPSGVGAYT